MQLVGSRSSGSKSEIDETHRGGIGSRLAFWGRDEVEEGGGSRCGLGMGLLAKMSAAGAAIEISAQTEEKFEWKGKRKEENWRKEKGDVGQGDASHKPKKKGKKAQAVGD